MYLFKVDLLKVTYRSVGLGAVILFYLLLARNSMYGSCHYNKQMLIHIHICIVPDYS